MNIIEQLKKLNKNEEYHFLVDSRYEQNTSILRLRPEVDKQFQKSIGKNANEFLKELEKELDILLLHPADVKGATGILQAIKKNEEFLVLFSGEETQKIRENIQLLEINRYNNLSFFSLKNIINFDFDYLLNNIEKVEESKRNQLLKFMAKNANNSVDFKITNFKDNLPSFFDIVFKYSSDNDAAKYTSNLFIKTSIVESHSDDVVLPILKRELKKGLPLLIEKSKYFNSLFEKEIFEKAYGYLLGQILLCEKEMTKEQADIVLKELREKKNILVEFKEKPTNLHFNKNNVKFIMDIINRKNKEIIFLGLSINEFMKDVSIKDLVPYIKNISFSDNWLQAETLMSLDTSSPENFITELDNFFSLSKMFNVSDEEKSEFYFPNTKQILFKLGKYEVKSENVDKFGGEEKILELVSLLDLPEVKTFINEKINSTSYKQSNLKYAYHPAIIIQDFLACKFTNFNKVANLIHDNVNELQDKKKALHSYMLRNIDLWLDENSKPSHDNVSLKINPNVLHILMECVAIEKNKVLDDIYDGNVEFYEYSKDSFGKHLNQENVYKRMKSTLERQILQEQVEFIVEPEVKSKRRL